MPIICCQKIQFESSRKKHFKLKLLFNLMDLMKTFRVFDAFLTYKILIIF